MDTSRCPSRQEIEKAFRTEASFEDKARLADHALVCPGCRAKLNLMAGLAVEMMGLAADRRGEERAGRAGRGPSRIRFFGRAFAPAAAAFMAAALLSAAFWLNAPPGDGHTFRGTGPAFLELIAPSGILRQPPRVFCWSPYQGVDTYGFELVDDRLETLIPYDTIHGTTAVIVPEAVAGRIVPGRTYIWRLWALDENNLPIASEQKSFELRPRAQSPDKINPAQ